MAKSKDVDGQDGTPTKGSTKVPGQCSKPDCMSTKLGADKDYVCPAHEGN